MKTICHVSDSPSWFTGQGHHDQGHLCRDRRGHRDHTPDTDLTLGIDLLTPDIAVQGRVGQGHDTDTVDDTMLSTGRT